MGLLRVTTRLGLLWSDAEELLNRLELRGGQVRWVHVVSAVLQGDQCTVAAKSWERKMEARVLAVPLGYPDVMIRRHQIAGKEPRGRSDELNQVLHALVPTSGGSARTVEVAVVDDEALFACGCHYMRAGQPPGLPARQAAVRPRLDALADFG